MRKRILIADDHEMILEGVSKLLSPDFDIVGQVKDGRAVVAQARTLERD